ncbi:molybdopterin dinucleotide binding domain-containing protein, partial [Gordonia alkanivorans]
VVSLEQRQSTVTPHADVVFPVGTVAEKEGTFVDWEGRPRSFTAALTESGQIPDHRVLDALARRLGVELRCDGPQTIHMDLRRIGAWSGERPAVVAHERPQRAPESGQAVLATWHMLLDLGRLQDGEPHLAGTARPPVARMSPTTAAEAGVAVGGRVRISTADGEIALPVEYAEMPDRVVWVPLNSPCSRVHADLRARAGDLVALSPASSADVAGGVR